MKILLFIYFFGVVASFVSGLCLLWVFADQGTQSYDYKISKVLINYALVFPYGLVKVIQLLEQESKE